MLYEISYYFFSSVCLGGLCLGISLMVYPDRTKNFLYRTSWQITKQTLIFKDQVKKLYNETIIDSIVEEESVKNNDDKLSIMVINKDTNNISTMKYNYDELHLLKPLNDDSTKIVFVSKTVSDKEYWKEVDTSYLYGLKRNKQVEYLNNVDIIEKPFIQVLIHNNNNSIDINEYLELFYVNGNQILNHVFLKWYLYYYYNIELDIDYKLDIIDSNIKMYTLKKYDNVLFTNNTYEITCDAC